MFQQDFRFRSSMKTDFRKSLLTKCFVLIILIFIIIIIITILPRTPGIGQGLGRILSCGARKPEQT